MEKIKTGEFRRPSGGDLKPGKEAICGKLPLGGRELLRPALTSTLESGCDGDHVKSRREAAGILVYSSKKKSRPQQQILPGAF